MSTWFHNYRTKTMKCRDCGTDVEMHEESTFKITLCTTCLDPYVKRVQEKVFESLKGGTNHESN